MAEEWGSIVIKASQETTDLFTAGKTSEGLEKLVVEAGLDINVLERGHGAIEEVITDSGYIRLAYDCSEWTSVSEALVSKGIGVEYYARHGDEYGRLSFLALTGEGKRLGFDFDQDGDAMEDESYQARIIEQIDAWKAIIPDAVKNIFPKFSDVNAEDCIF